MFELFELFKIVLMAVFCIFIAAMGIVATPIAIIAAFRCLKYMMGW